MGCAMNDKAQVEGDESAIMSASERTDAPRPDGSMPSISYCAFLEGLLRESFGKLTIDVEKIDKAYRRASPKLTKRCFLNRLYYVSKHPVEKLINRSTAMRLHTLYAAILCGHSDYAPSEVTAISAVLAVWLGRVSGLRLEVLACALGDDQATARVKSSLLCDLLLKAVGSAGPGEYFDRAAMRAAFTGGLKEHLNEPQVSRQIMTILDCYE